VQRLTKQGFGEVKEEGSRQESTEKKQTDETACVSGGAINSNDLPQLNNMFHSLTQNQPLSIVNGRRMEKHHYGRGWLYLGCISITTLKIQKVCKKCGTNKN
jgi:hypothetical protein